jgi:hypothetical protein
MDGFPHMRSFVREIWNHNDRFFARSLLIGFAAVTAFYIILFIYAIGSGHYNFVHDDEFNYIGSAKLFSETGSVRAPLCMLEEVSKIFGANWYGFSYNIFYGTLYYVFGEHAVIFILTNIVFLFLCALLIFKVHIDSYNKLFALITLLLSYPVMVYSFMFFPEMLHIFLALVQFIFLFIIFQIYNSGGNYKKYLVLFVVLAIAFSLFRVTSVFWIAGIFPFCKNKKQFFLFVAAFIFSVALVMAYMHYFIAPAFVYPMGSIESLKQFRFNDFFSMWSKYASYNSTNLLTSTIKEPQVFILMLLFAYSVFKSFFKNGKLFLSAVLISLCYFAALISFYNVNPFYFTKQTAVLFPLFICIIAFTTSLPVRKFVLLGFLVALPFTFISASEEINNRKIAGIDHCNKYSLQISELKLISSLVDQEKRNLILFVHYEHKFPRYIFYDALPLSNDKGYPITYTASVYNESLYPDMSYNARFVRYGIQKVDYVISRDSLNLTNVDLLYHSPYYNFYKDNR